MVEVATLGLTWGLVARVRRGHEERDTLVAGEVVAGPCGVDMTTALGFDVSVVASDGAVEMHDMIVLGG